MEKFVLFCKSFRDDVLRAKVLIESSCQFNEDKIPFYLSVPKNDFELFQAEINFEKINALSQGTLKLITDEEIVLSNPNSSLEDYYAMRGYLNQQVIKAEAWRLIGCESYLCIDSDTRFTKPFRIANFIHPDGNPYTLMHDNHELLALAKKLGKTRAIEAFARDNQLLKNEFNRMGEDFDFGPSPLIWSAKVWQALEKEHLSVIGERIWEAIERLPHEIRWYGETLLKFKPIPIYPIEPIFKVFHYDWQYKEFMKNPSNSSNYIGELRQSYWEETLRPNFAKKSIFSRLWRKFKTWIRNE